jgi:hypothetical protein
LPTCFELDDYEKAFDQINMKLLWEILTENVLQYHITSILQGFYLNNVANIRAEMAGKMTAETDQGVQHRCPILTILFTFYLNEVI